VYFSLGKWASLFFLSPFSWHSEQITFHDGDHQNYKELCTSMHSDVRHKFYSDKQYYNANFMLVYTYHLFVQGFLLLIITNFN